MKNLMTILTTVVFTIAIGVAYADEVPMFDSSRDVGTEIYDEAVATDEKYEAGLGDREEMGSAAGGIARENETDKIWDTLLAPTHSEFE